MRGSAGVRTIWNGNSRSKSDIYGRVIVGASMMKRGEILKTSTEYKKEIYEKDTLSHYQKSYLILVTDTVN